MIEYGVAYRKTPDRPYRSDMTSTEAKDWIQQWKDGGGNPSTFVLIRRKVGPWTQEETND